MYVERKIFTRITNHKVVLNVFYVWLNVLRKNCITGPSAITAIKIK